ncbi:hypothetical protein RF55_11007 [Lasius niger]|uniref:Regulatory protein zeste n=1 Tax=Lasius niger TaxID=67767 RepID=A0A0J7KGG7_LASNI|nr:hypothetical protein RF55_11007 [Lasius niger]
MWSIDSRVSQAGQLGDGTIENLNKLSRREVWPHLILHKKTIPLCEILYENRTKRFCYMKQHPDFGRGRLRYNSENKRKIDELWEKLSLTLNTAGYGPRKSPKEWAKTWRDWKSNVLKKVAKHKTYMMGTGGGSPKELQLSSTENALLNFLTLDASGLNEIPEGGFTNTMPTYDNNFT